MQECLAIFIDLRGRPLTERREIACLVLMFRINTIVDGIPERIMARNSTHSCLEPGQFQ